MAEPREEPSTDARVSRCACVREDLQFLVDSGVREGVDLARRLGFTNENAFERYCYRHEIPLLHKKKEPVLNARKLAARLYGRREPDPDPVLVTRARAVIMAKLGDDPSVPDVLDMLGLGDSEQQLAPAS